MNKPSKPLLAIVANLKPTPIFFITYAVIWILWHNKFFLTLLTSHGDFSERMSSAVDAIGQHQYLLVLFITFMISLGLSVFDYLSQLSNEDEVVEGVDLLENANNAASLKELDIKQLIATLELTQKKLTKSREKEKQAKNEKLDAVSKLIELQNKLDEALADVAILTKENHALKMQNENHKTYG